MPPLVSAISPSIVTTASQTTVNSLSSAQL